LPLESSSILYTRMTLSFPSTPLHSFSSTQSNWASIPSSWQTTAEKIVSSSHLASTCFSTCSF
jgi:hypothetical protein